MTMTVTAETEDLKKSQEGELLHSIAIADMEHVDYEKITNFLKMPMP